MDCGNLLIEGNIYAAGYKYCYYCNKISQYTQIMDCTQKKFRYVQKLLLKVISDSCIFELLFFSLTFKNLFLNFF